MSEPKVAPERRPRGRPVLPADQRTRLVAVRLTAAQIERAQALGGGDISAGIRAALFGHRPVITYTLPSEGGASLRAAGFRLDKQNAGGPARDWHNRPGRRVLPIEDADLVGGKWRWGDE